MVYTQTYKEYCSKFKECLNAIEQSYSMINNENVVISEISRRAFKADMIDMFKILEQYSSYVLKFYKVSVSDMTVGESLNRCAQFGKFDEELVKKTRRYKALRDKYSHHYGKPSLRTFIEFYKNSKEDLNRQYELMVRIYKSSEKEYSKINKVEF